MATNRLCLCPKDGARLVPAGTSRTSLQNCRSCHGVWIPAADLSEALQKRADRTPSDISTVASSRGCPACGTTMQTRRAGQVDIDVCPSCRGVWLDVGELEALIEWHQNQSPTPRSAVLTAVPTSSLDYPLGLVRDLADVFFGYGFQRRSLGLEVTGALVELVADAVLSVIDF